MAKRYLYVAREKYGRYFMSGKKITLKDGIVILNSVSKTKMFDIDYGKQVRIDIKKLQGLVEGVK